MPSTRYTNFGSRPGQSHSPETHLRRRRPFKTGVSFALTRAGFDHTTMEAERVLRTERTSREPALGAFLSLVHDFTEPAKTREAGEGGYVTDDKFTRQYIVSLTYENPPRRPALPPVITPPGKPRMHSRIQDAVANLALNDSHMVRPDWRKRCLSDFAFSGSCMRSFKRTFMRS